MLNILIVDDSRTEAKLLQLLFESEPDIKVVGIAHNGREAVDMVARLKPDIISMDLEMPVMDGHTATRVIMSHHPTPIVVLSSRLDDASRDMTFLALEAGAVSVMPKPINIGEKNFEQTRKRIIDTMRAMSEIKVIKKRFKTQIIEEKAPILMNDSLPSEIEIVAIGASIGGPQALKNILSHLPADFPVPIVIVQHIAKGFICDFTKWLNENVTLEVKNIENYEVLKGGVVYLAPDSFHLTIKRSQNSLMANLVSGEPVSGFCPSISVLLESVAKVSGKKAVGLLLTGMGNDGSQGLLDLKHAKGHTLIQDEKSCVVFGMAGVALSLGAVDKIIEIDQIADYLVRVTQPKK